MNASVEKPATSEIGILNQRSRQIFREIIDSYLETGNPVGSRTLARRLNGSLSSASIRNVMADLETLELLYAPHTSAGRLPTERGLRMFIDGLLEIGDLSEDERNNIETQCSASGRSMEDVLTQASEMLSGLSGWAGLVMAPKAETNLKHVEFVRLGNDRALVVLVAETGAIENRMIQIPAGLPPSSLIEAANYLNDRMRGRSISEAQERISKELDEKNAELDALTQKVIESGLATWGGGGTKSLIVRGRANLLDDVTAATDLERIRQLFVDLENKQALINVLELANDAAGVQVFVGSENRLFSLSGSSMIIAPYQNSKKKVVGAIGVIGPTHLNYARIVPMVDYTAKVIGRIVG